MSSLPAARPRRSPMIEKLLAVLPGAIIAVVTSVVAGVSVFALTRPNPSLQLIITRPVYTPASNRGFNT